MANRLLFVKARARRKAQREAVGRMNKRESILRFHPSSLIPHPSIARALRGDVSAASVLRETWRRGRVALESRRERARLKRASGVAATDASARLRPEFAALSPTQLLAHFRTRRAPRFPPGLETPAERLSPLWWREFFPGESEQLVARAHHISDAHRWPLLGFGELELGTEINWLRDPSSGACWSLEYHGDVKLWRGDGSDVRVLWELNRLAHLLTLGQAYALTGDEKFSGEFFRQLAGWRTQNPTGCGPNWACAMEVALRAVNLLAAFQLFLPSTQLDEANLRMLLATFDEHGQHVRRHLEFSHLATSNHYLSDIAGLLWLGLLLPELVAARGWREFARREMLREMDKQILADGADAESSTGYHRFVLELLLYSFTLCRANDVEIEDRYWRKLRRMLEYTRAYLRPDRRAPLVGDTDGGQFLPLRKRAADDHAYVLAIGAAVLQEPHLKLADDPPAELGWLLGAEGLRAYQSVRRAAAPPPSAAFADAGSYILRDGDLYLHFNACGAGLGGRGSHGHNDKLSVEVFAHGVSFIADPGTFVYTADLRARHLFRSTAYHSTVEVDETEQNTTREAEPFVIGDEARPRVLRWETTAERDFVLAEHDGYHSLREPITHRRAILFDKRAKFWLVEDALTGAGTHTFRFRFHAAPRVIARARPDAIVELRDPETNARLLIVPLDAREVPAIEPRSASSDYGSQHETHSACWAIRARAPLLAAWALVPLAGDEDENTSTRLIEELRETRKREAA